MTQIPKSPKNATLVNSDLDQDDHKAADKTSLALFMNARDTQNPIWLGHVEEHIKRRLTTTVAIATRFNTFKDLIRRKNSAYTGPTLVLKSLPTFLPPDALPEAVTAQEKEFNDNSNAIGTLLNDMIDNNLGFLSISQINPDILPTVYIGQNEIETLIALSFYMDYILHKDAVADADQQKKDAIEYEKARKEAEAKVAQTNPARKTQEEEEEEEKEKAKKEATEKEERIATMQKNLEKIQFYTVFLVRAGTFFVDFDSATTDETQQWLMKAIDAVSMAKKEAADFEVLSNNKPVRLSGLSLFKQLEEEFKKIGAIFLPDIPEKDRAEALRHRYIDLVKTLASSLMALAFRFDFLGIELDILQQTKRLHNDLLQRIITNIDSVHALPKGTNVTLDDIIRWARALRLIAAGDLSTLNGLKNDAIQEEAARAAAKLKADLENPQRRATILVEVGTFFVDVDYATTGDTEQRLGMAVSRLSSITTRAAEIEIIDNGNSMLFSAHPIFDILADALDEVEVSVHLNPTTEGIAASLLDRYTKLVELLANYLRDSVDQFVYTGLDDAALAATKELRVSLLESVIANIKSVPALPKGGNVTLADIIDWARALRTIAAGDLISLMTLKVLKFQEIVAERLEAQNKERRLLMERTSNRLAAMASRYLRPPMTTDRHAMVSAYVSIVGIAFDNESRPLVAFTCQAFKVVGIFSRGTVHERATVFSMFMDRTAPSILVQKVFNYADKPAEKPVKNFSIVIKIGGQGNNLTFDAQSGVFTAPNDNPDSLFRWATANTAGSDYDVLLQLWKTPAKDEPPAIRRLMLHQWHADVSRADAPTAEDKEEDDADTAEIYVLPSMPKSVPESVVKPRRASRSPTSSKRTGKRKVHVDRGSDVERSAEDSGDDSSDNEQLSFDDPDQSDDDDDEATAAESNQASPSMKTPTKGSKGSQASDSEDPPFLSPGQGSPTTNGPSSSGNLDQQTHRKTRKKTPRAPESDSDSG